jgi:hypothetical protein
MPGGYKRRVDMPGGCKRRVAMPGGCKRRVAMPGGYKRRVAMPGTYCGVLKAVIKQVGYMIHIPLCSHDAFRSL